MLQDPARSNKILQDPTRSYKILRDSTGYEKKIGMESISIANKILQDPTRFYGIREKNWYGIHINSKKDPTRS